MWSTATQNANVWYGDTMFDQIEARVSNNQTVAFSTVRRSGERIRLTRDGDVIQVETAQKAFEIPVPKNAVWYQTPGLLLDSFILSKSDRFSFVLVGLDRMALVAFDVRKMTREPIDVNGQIWNDAQKVELRPSGFLGLFWVASMWFDASTGQFLKYEGLIGGPGSKWFQIEKRLDFDHV